MNKIILQRIRREEKDTFYIAFRYYSILSAINDLFLTERELQLITFTAVKGNISYKYLREEFCEKYNTSFPTINNTISHLKKKHLLVKESGKIKVNPILVLNFSNDVQLQISLLHGQA